MRIRGYDAIACDVTSFGERSRQRDAHGRAAGAGGIAWYGALARRIQHLGFDQSDRLAEPNDDLIGCALDQCPICRSGLQHHRVPVDRPGTVSPRAAGANSRRRSSRGMNSFDLVGARRAPVRPTPLIARLRA